MFSGIQVYFFFHFLYDCVSNVFRYAVVGVMEEFQTSLEVLQVKYVRQSFVGHVFQHLFARLDDLCADIWILY